MVHREAALSSAFAVAVVLAVATLFQHHLSLAPPVFLALLVERFPVLAPLV